MTGDDLRRAEFSAIVEPMLQPLSVAARSGYLAHGRGAVVVMLPNLADTGGTGYLTADRIPQRDGVGQDVQAALVRMVSTYEPSSRGVVLLDQGEGQHCWVGQFILVPAVV